MPRIISGKYKGLTLKTPNGLNTRPSADKLKEAMFSALEAFLYSENLIENFHDFAVLELFAGSGQLGFECFSRGVKEVSFVDNNIKAFQVIRDNKDKLDQSDVKINNIYIYKQDAGNFLRKSLSEDKKYDLIILDPPYPLFPGIWNKLQENIFSSLTKNGIVILESPSFFCMNMDIVSFQILRKYEYKVSNLYFLKNKNM